MEMPRWIALGVASALLIAGLVGFLIWNRARFQIAVQPRLAPSLAECRSILLRHDFPSASVADTCGQAERLPWFHVSVRNTGHAAAYAYCWAHGYDRSGQTVLRVSIPLGTFGPSLPHLAPGESLQGVSYFHVTPTGRVDRYTAGCWRSSSAGPL
jgi:hypothetical protein